LGVILVVMNGCPSRIRSLDFITFAMKLICLFDFGQ